MRNCCDSNTYYINRLELLRELPSLLQIESQALRVWLDYLSCVRSVCLYPAITHTFEHWPARRKPLLTSTPFFGSVSRCQQIDSLCIIDLLNCDFYIAAIHSWHLRQFLLRMCFIGCSQPSLHPLVSRCKTYSVFVLGFPTSFSLIFQIRFVCTHIVSSVFSLAWQIIIKLHTQVTLDIELDTRNQTKQTTIYHSNLSLSTIQETAQSHDRWVWFGRHLVCGMCCTWCYFR